jgi:hypothetical protein
MFFFFTLSDQFPDCTIKCDNFSPNLVYIFSIFLYYSCVKHPEQYFQQCCSKLDGNNQSIITKFFCQLVEHQSNLNKEAIRGAIQQASKWLNLNY